MSTTPFARRKRKAEKLEEPPIIRLKPVPAPEAEPSLSGEATKTGIIVPDDATEVLLRLQGKPEKIITPDTVTHDGFMELIRRSPKPPPRPVIYGDRPPLMETADSAEGTPTKAATADHIKLGEGDATLWREAVRPTKKAEEK